MKQAVLLVCCLLAFVAAKEEKLAEQTLQPTQLGATGLGTGQFSGGYPPYQGQYQQSLFQQPYQQSFYQQPYQQSFLQQPYQQSFLQQPYLQQSFFQQPYQQSYFQQPYQQSYLQQPYYQQSFMSQYLPQYQQPYQTRFNPYQQGLFGGVPYSGYAGQYGQTAGLTQGLGQGGFQTLTGARGKK